jgi:hypothetical protein
MSSKKPTPANPSTTEKRGKKAKPPMTETEIAKKFPYAAQLLHDYPPTFMVRIFIINDCILFILNVYCRFHFLFL